MTDISDIDIPCRNLHDFPNLTDTCWFVKNVSSCDIEEGFINYTHLLYCAFGDIPIGLACTFVIIWWLFLLTGLAVTADDFFCPSLAVISQSLKLSHNVAGVTFLAFGNGAADIFSASAAIGSVKAGNAGLAIGALFGAGVFVTAVVAGTIAIINPFYSMERPFLRDVIFFLLATYCAFYIMWDKKITQLEAAGLIGLYLVYVAVVIIGRYINKSMERRNRRRLKQRGQLSNLPESYTINEPDALDHSSDDSEEYEDNLPRTPLLQDRPVPTSYNTATVPKSSSSSMARIAHVNSSDYSIPYDENVESEGARRVRTTGRSGDDNDLEIEMAAMGKDRKGSGRSANLLLMLLEDVNPINAEEWGEMRIYGKIFEVFKSPFKLCLSLTIPVVGEAEDDNPLRNWNRPLNSLQLFLGPIFASIATEVGFHMLGDVFPVYGLVIIVSAIFAAIVFFTSKTDERPVYHTAFAYIGFVIAIVWIYSIANEIVNILQALGVVFGLSDAILGLTLLAWGNGMGDFIANMSMARQGYPRMAISACFGGPLFNLLIGLGLPFSFACAKQGGTFELVVNLEEIVLAVGLLASLSATLIIVPLSGFKMSRPYGIFLLCFYVAFLIIAVLTEIDVIENITL